MKELLYALGTVEVSGNTSAIFPCFLCDCGRTYSVIHQKSPLKGQSLLPALSQLAAVNPALGNALQLTDRVRVPGHSFKLQWEQPLFYTLQPF